MPRWLAEPTRFAALPWRQARVAGALAVLLVLACFTALQAPGVPAHTQADAPAAERTPDRTDVLLYQEVIDGLRHGQDYYSTAAEAMRRGPYPLKPFVTFRLPTLAMVQARLPDWASVALLFAIAIGALAAWWDRFEGAFARTTVRIVAVILLAAGMSSFIRPDLVTFHEVWAGPLIALSLGLRKPGNATAAIAVAAIAMLIRETSALYAGLMLLAAARERRWREVAGWAAALVLLVVVVAFHAHAVAQVVRPFDDGSRGWSGMLGFGFAVHVLVLATALSQGPLWLGAPLVGVALIGWAGWRSPFAKRVLMTLIGYGVLLALFCRADTYYWVLLAAPLLLPGLAFAPDAIRDLRSAALDRRRITVTRTRT
ncbi:hypothetical protein [Sphingomonas sp.]|uniref:hypothetical protein n=1 Tax=Sphingomonas sp. TaxID=28214 RepID=UPI0035C7CCFA